MDFTLLGMMWSLIKGLALFVVIYYVVEKYTND